MADADDHAHDDPGHRADCREAVRRLYHFLDGELTVERRMVIRRHLDDCSDCIEAYEFEAVLRVAVSRGCRETVPESLRARVHQALSCGAPVHDALSYGAPGYGVPGYGAPGYDVAGQERSAAAVTGKPRVPPAP